MLLRVRPEPAEADLLALIVAPEACPEPREIGAFSLLGAAIGEPLPESEADVAIVKRVEGEAHAEPRVVFGDVLVRLLIPEEAAPQFLDDAAPRNGMMPPPDSEMIAPPITE